VTHSPHPFRPGELCVTREINPSVYLLPEGLALGAKVRTVKDRVGREWEVIVVLLLSKKTSSTQ